MFLSIESYIESVLHLEKTLPALKESYAETDSNGRPVFYSTKHTVVFSIVRGGCKMTLTILTDAENNRSVIAQRTNETQTGLEHIACAEFLPQALCVIGADGSVTMCDVMIQPSYDRLNDFIRKNSSESHRQSLRNGLESVADTACYLSRVNFTHAGLRLHNICFDRCDSVVLTDYPLIHNWKDENRALAISAVMLFVAGCDFGAYRILTKYSDAEATELESLRRRLLSAAEYYGIEPLATMLKPSMQLSTTDEYCKAIKNLAATPFHSMPLLIRMLSDNREVICDDIRPKITPVTVDFTKCDFVAQISDLLVRFRKDGVWGYADRNGIRLKIDKPLTGAFDFYEGRAVVRTAEGYGLIDQCGRWIMHDGWSDMVWHGRENVVTACNDAGQWYVYNRMGQQLSTIPCQWLGDCSEGFVVGRRGDKFGYISSTGCPLTDFIYDSACCFDGGRALVERRGRRYHIDTSGHQISARAEEMLFDENIASADTVERSH